MKAKSLLRRLPLWKRAVCFLLLFLFSFCLLSLAVSAAVWPLLFGRRDEVAAVEPVYTAADAQSLPRRGVSFRSGKNTLHGWLYGEENEGGLMIVSHGVGSGADSFLPLIRAFTEAGYTVLAYDGTGTRGSEGRGIRGLSQAALDLEAALDYAAGESSLAGKPVFLFGHSAGAYAAALQAGRPEVAAVVCIAAFDEPTELMLAQARERVGFLADLEAPFMRLQQAIVFGKRGFLRADEALSVADCPVLIVQGSADRTVPEALSLYGRRGEIRNPHAEYLVITEAWRNGHANAWLSQRAGLARSQLPPEDRAICNELDEDFLLRVLDFFRDAAALRQEAA